MNELGSPATPGLVERLRQQAKGASEAERMMAEAKSARNQAAGDDGASYMWSKPEQTLEWQAADEIERLRTELSRAYRATYGLYNAAREARTPSDAMMGYHSLTFGAAARFVREGALDGADYFIGKHFSVLHAVLHPAAGGLNQTSGEEA